MRETRQTAGSTTTTGSHYPLEIPAPLHLHPVSRKPPGFMPDPDLASAAGCRGPRACWYLLSRSTPFAPVFVRGGDFLESHWKSALKVLALDNPGSTTAGKRKATWLEIQPITPKAWLVPIINVKAWARAGVKNKSGFVFKYNSFNAQVRFSALESTIIGFQLPFFDEPWLMTKNGKQ